MNGGWQQYLAVFVSSCVLSLIGAPIIVRIAIRRKIFDLPGGHKSHSRPVPYLGGVSILLAFSVSVLVVSLLDSSSNGDQELLKVLLIAFALSILGLVDDLKSLPASGRLVVEVAAGVALFAFDLGVSFLPSAWLNAAATVLWVAGLVNAVNMVDNMDGLAAGLVAIASASLFAVAASNDQFLVAGMCAALSGCAVGFLRLNSFPAKVYMGDAGAYFFGFLIAYLGLKLQFVAGPSNNTFLVPIVVCSVVVLDASLVIITRVARGVSPFVGGRDHTSHRLVRLGFSVPVAVASICSVGVVVGVIAFVIARVDDTSGWILTSLVAGVLLALGFLLALVPHDDASSNQGRLWRPSTSND